MPANLYSLKFNIVGYIDKNIPNLVFVLFIFQQFGVTYHLSAASVGLGLLAYFVRNEFTVPALRLCIVVSIAITISFMIVIVKYGYSENFLRLFPTLVCVILLILILRKDIEIPAPNSKLILIISIFLCLVGFYQLFVDRTLQIPDSFLAKGEGSNISLAADDNIYDYYKYTLRTNSIYTEPSYFGMILSCLYVLTLKTTEKLKSFMAVLIVVALILSGSMLGIVGIILLTPMLLGERFNFFILLFIFSLLFLPLSIIIISQWADNQIMGYDLSFVDRFSNLENDHSFIVRIFNPLYLVLENIKNFDFFGVPSDTFQHYLYTNLYSTLEDFPGHNGFFSLIINYGVAGVIVICVILMQLRSPLEFVILIIIASQNGSFLTYDKVLSIMFVILSIRQKIIKN